MKDENGIEICCENCRNTIFGSKCYFCKSYDKFLPTDESYEARIAELQKELYIVQGSERAEAQEADRLRGEVKELGKKLTETIKLWGERSRECGELEAQNEVLQRRVREFSMELLDRTMKENKDVLERLKEAESEEKDDSLAENIVSWIEENQNQDLSKFLSNLDICCYSTKYNEDIICIQPNGENGWNFEIAQLFPNLRRTLAQYNRTKPFTKGFLKRVELLFKIHNGQTNEQLKHILKAESDEK